MKTKEITRVSVALLIWAGVLFLSISLFSFSSGDINYLTAVDSTRDISNLCGSVGAFVSYHLYMQLGLGAWLLMILLASAAFMLLYKPIKGVWIRVYGAVFLIISSASLIAFLDTMPGYPPSKLGLPFTYGGTVGYTVTKWLVSHLNTAGAIIILATVFLISLAITSNLYAYELAMSLGKKIMAKTTNGNGKEKKPKAAVAEKSNGLGGVLKSKKAIDLEKELEEEEEPEGPEREEDSKPSLESKPKAISSLQPREPDYEETELPFEDEEAPIKHISTPRPKNKPERKKPSVETDEDEYQLPPMSLYVPATTRQKDFTSILEKQGQAIESCLNDFGIEAKVVRWEVGPVVTLYEVALPPGVKVSSVSSLADNLAMSLKAQSLRIIAPIPGKSTIGLETPNPEAETVVFRDVSDAELFNPEKFRLPMLLGKRGAGEPLVADLTKMPHVLIAGATGSGKSVCLNSMILSILSYKRPDEVKLIMIDPKMVELSPYKRIPHLIAPVVSDMRKAPGVLDWAVNQMEERYRKFSQVGVRDIAGYNKLGSEKLDELLPDPEEREEYPDKYPYIVIVVDELADLMMISKKEIEWSITRLAQKSRAIGIHIVLATQRPSVNVITGLIKANMPCRISFQVSSKVDSRTIIDQMGADKLLGRGDMLYLPPSSPRLIRAQGVFISDEEIKRVVEFIRGQGEPEYDPLLEKAANRSIEAHKSDGGKPSSFEGGGVAGKKRVSYTSEPAPSQDEGKGGDTGFDELFEDAVRVVLEEQRGSVSLLQRKLTVGYGRASRLIDQMEEAGILGPYRGSKPREILFTLEEWESRNSIEEGEVE